MCFCAAGSNQYRNYNEEGQKSAARWRSTAEELAVMGDGQEITDTRSHLSCFSQQDCRSRMTEQNSLAAVI